MADPPLSLRLPAPPIRAVALVLPGGRASSLAPARPWRLAAVRMWPFVQALRGIDGLAVGMVRYRYRGWNGAAAHPVADVEATLDAVATQFPGVPIALVGHSMGGRAALRAAGHSGVSSVAALAPWLTEEDPVQQLAGRAVLIAHGDQERVTDPALSYAYAVRARAVTDRVCRFEVRGDGHAMLRRARDWHRLVRRFVAGSTGIEPLDPAFSSAYQDGLRVPLAS
jgi:pimeloyl-ACP methyl ester carboxylesterase